MLLGPGALGERLLASQRREERAPRDTGHAGIPVPIEAGGVEQGRCEVDLAHLEASSAALTWKTVEPLDGVAPGSLRAESVSVGEVPETIVFHLSANPGWRGTITDLRLYPVFRGNQTYELGALRFAHHRHNL